MTVNGERSAGATAVVPAGPAHAGGAETGGVRDTATVLFVDDEPRLLEGMRRILRRARPGWNVVFAPTGAEALGILADRPVDAIVTDMRMPEMDGNQLLTAVQERFPQVARLILSGYTDRDAAIASVGPTQQFLCKPVDNNDLVGALDRVLALHFLVADPRLRELLCGVTALPKPPEIYQRMNAVTADPDYDLDDLVAVIGSDLTTSAEILRLVNTSFFGLPVRVESVAQAVTLLGLATIETLAVAGGVLTSGGRLPPGLDSGQLSLHGLAVGALARKLAEAEKWSPSAVKDVFMAGLLHPLGLPVLASSYPAQWQAVRHLPLSDVWTEHSALTQHFGCAATTASAYLLGLWGFPETVVRALADQPADPSDPNATPAGLLLTFARQHVLNPEQPLTAPAEGYLDAERLSRWERVAAEAEVPA